jgi:hypothetical protein
MLLILEYILNSYHRSIIKYSIKDYQATKLLFLKVIDRLTVIKYCYIALNQ